MMPKSAYRFLDKITCHRKSACLEVSGSGLARVSLSANVLWTGTEMTGNRTAKLTIALLACAALSAWAAAATPPAGLDTPESALSPGVEPSADRPAVAITRE